MANPIRLKVLKSVHPRLDLAYAERLRCLYKGGKHLLQNERVMDVVFPRHQLEEPGSYRERARRAVYDNDMAMTVNKILSGLAQDPIHFDDDGASVGVADAEPIPKYWADLQDDARSPGDAGPRKTLDELVAQSILEGVVCGWGWMLCDLPRPPVDETGASLIKSVADEERWDTKRAYPVPYRVDQVRDWLEEDGKLVWLKTYEERPEARAPEDARGDWTVHTWRVWDDLTIATYRLVLDSEGKTKGGVKIDDEMLVPVADEVPHSFEMVPWVCFDAAIDDEPSLWLGDALESRCRSLFVLTNDDEYLRRMGSFPQLYEFLGPEDGGPDQIIPEAQTNPNRAGRRLASRAPGAIQCRGAADRAEYVSPEMGASAANRVALGDGREQIPRTIGMLAYLNDTSGALIKRSGESKAQDQVSERVVMGAIGRRALAFANAVKEMLARGRGDSLDGLPKLKGYENFDTENAASRIEETVALVGAPINSATFQIEHQVMVAKAVLGPTTDPDTLAQIRSELEESITQESINQSSMPSVPPGHQLDETGKPVPLPPRLPEEPRSMPPKKK